MKSARSVHDVSSDSEHTEETSSNTSYSVTDPKKTVKRCCRKIVTFMCTQVGVGGLIVGYAVVGAFSFKLIESTYSDPHMEEMLANKNHTIELLWNITDKFNVLENASWNNEVLALLSEYQSNITILVRKGYNGANGNAVWEFPAALMFCLSVFTMIGYGNMVPHTTQGKVATIVYAVFGIPLYILYFKNMGKVLAQTFRWTYTWIYRCSMEDSHPKQYEKNELPPKRIIVPSTACLWVLFAYVGTGTAMFSSWQSWSVMDSAYFCVTSLCKIGIGDFAPDNILVPAGGDPTRLVFTFVYLLFGMGIIAMCFDLMKEDVTVRMGFEDSSMTRIKQLLGHDGRRNDVLHVSKLESRELTDNVVIFFGGDIQDFRENMKNNAEGKNYIQWCLENVAVLLHQKFRHSDIVVIQPSRYDREIFSCYDNFVSSGKYGIPSFVPYNKALRHLEQLLNNLAVRIHQDHQFSDKEHNSAISLTMKQKQQRFVNFGEAKITLIGFSKGCVVLNQFIREFSFLRADADKNSSIEKSDLVSRITDMYFLDGGHAGNKETWITDRRLLQIFCTVDINVHIHVTPYQIKDMKRPWIGEEEKIFYKTLRDQKVKVFRKLHFENEKPSLSKHFEILKSFA